MQHLFSACVGIGTHKPHLHQSGECWLLPGSSGSCGTSGLSDASWFSGSGGFSLMFGNSPFIKSANNAGCRLSSSIAKRLTAPSFRPFISSYKNLKDNYKIILLNT